LQIWDTLEIFNFIDNLDAAKEKVETDMNNSIYTSDSGDDSGDEEWVPSE
jgi:hypothetical protein